MKILVLADIHSRISQLENTKKHLIHNIDWVLLLGDNTNYGGTSDIKKIIETIGISPEKILALPGNLDTKEVLNFFEAKKISLHAKKKKIGNFVFIGFGGGLLGSAGAINFSEEEIYSTLKKLCKAEKNITLCTHLPPFGTSLDLAASGKHIGSKAVKKTIQEFQPAIALCAHCHEATGEEKIGKSTCINTGALKDGNFLILELGEKISWNFKKI